MQGDYGDASIVMEEYLVCKRQNGNLIGSTEQKGI